MKDYDIVKFPISDTESMWDVLKYNAMSGSWSFRHSFETRTEARRYVRNLRYAREYAAKRKAM